MQHQARKRFGQHFLTDTALVEKMVRAIAPTDEQIVVEIGPGQGALTLPLLDRIQHLQVVELDRDLITELERRIAKQRITIHSADALKFDFSSLAQNGQRVRVVGNLPYNISTPLMFHLLDQVDVIEDMCFMLQKEVVDRLVASPGTADWGRLSVMIQYYCQNDYLFFVPPTAFSPPPKVDSAVVRLTPYRQLPHPADDVDVLRRVVAQAFTQRRKVISNGLKSFLTSEQIAAAGVDPGLRPDSIGLAGFVSLANQVSRLSSAAQPDNHHAG
ncbi:16S rRNA (adenine(1518)-N(6)/adenine(1519)-N(6))-dimethyltransferase RsmA [Alcanivorax sp. 1008]|uniref:16S rRNA (adenine(1518)-N(6)/adenine(1519)-N(6))- dimethyltransferase RsmA n=1 Tax=Alcanivorax sp. 1008 TaxID=2816853 RepID=UPI001E09982C|nr:16S rRNA (adenine(1518)-N(6)/adenine(1519)-N(6))-dimethyltransferase RsmA [Alcanivorax sp. 1008]MCC1496630.1 16S rRNA (adenine(1518)-N(6)/adenine(1519)-N(6))-dimethyltransferase RsmA [Alcanivorax sp. 1008]